MLQGLRMPSWGWCWDTVSSCCAMVVRGAWECFSSPTPQASELPEVDVTC